MWVFSEWSNLNRASSVSAKFGPKLGFGNAAQEFQDTHARCLQLANSNEFLELENRCSYVGLGVLAVGYGVLAVASEKERVS